MKSWPRRLLRAALAEQWTVGVVEAPIHAFLGGRVPGPVHWLPEPASGGFLADPFGRETPDGGLSILAEGFDPAAGRAAILSLGFRSGRFTPATTAIATDAHLSYPYLVDWEGTVYCVPECCVRGQIALWRAKEFPGSWEFDSLLIDGFDAVDSTLFRHEGRWWLLCTQKRDHGSNERLYAFFADALRGPWRPHQGNPVRRGRAGTRPGGTPFSHDGRLYRPTQDSSRTYGGRVVIQEVVTLTPQAFVERERCAVEPDPHGPYPHGLHTLSAAGRYTLIDGKRFRHPRLAGLHRAASGLASKVTG